MATERGQPMEVKELTEASQHDPLTGLLNRRGLGARIGSPVAASEVNDLPVRYGGVVCARLQARLQAPPTSFA